MVAAARLHFEDVNELEAARRLTIHEGTLKGRIRAIYAKMNVHSKVQFVSKVYDAWIDENFADHATDNS
jgi:hypothetical protein